MSVSDVRVRILKPNCVCALGNTQRREIVVGMTGITKEQRCLEFPLIQQLNSVPIIYQCHSRLQNSRREVCLHGNY